MSWDVNTEEAILHSKNKNTTTRRQSETVGCYSNTDLTHARVDKTAHKTEIYIYIYIYI